jgi:hypothetical protein
LSEGYPVPVHSAAILEAGAKTILEGVRNLKQHIKGAKTVT